MARLPLLATVPTFFAASLAFASEGNVDGDRMAECYASYDAMVALAEANKIPPAEKPVFEAQRLNAEARAIVLFKSEGLNEEFAREMLEGRALFMRSELRDIRDGAGIYGADEMRKMALACDALVNG